MRKKLIIGIFAMALIALYGAQKHEKAAQMIVNEFEKMALELEPTALGDTCSEVITSCKSTSLQ